MSGFDKALLTEASRAQALALDARQSVWISANAGTGKTEVLTRRMLALLLADPELEPKHILALTFTKAGAAEMAARLPARLMEWARLDDAVILQKVQELGVEADAATVAMRVRGLAEAVRKHPPLVATIHGLAQQVLGRFAVEAGLPVDFEVLEDGAQKRLLRAIQHDLLVSVDGALAEHLGTLLDELGEQGWEELTSLMVNAWHKFEALAVKAGGLAEVIARLQAQLGVDVSGAAGRPLVPNTVEWEALERIARALPGHGAAEVLRAYESVREAAWRGFLLTDKNTARARMFLKGELAALDEHDVALMHDAAARAEEQLRQRKIYRGFDVTRSALVWAMAVRGAYLQRKRADGLVDYGDLLDGLERVMNAADGGAAAWVWYGLDRRFRHLVVDEAQDNNPQQDRIVQWLAKSILSGDVGEGLARTVLAVGDMKQSIFRFQGAVPQLFLNLREVLRNWAPSVREVDLVHSFRSGKHVLALVDRVFADESGAVVTGEAGVAWPAHRAVAAERKSRVEIWETVEEPKEESVPAWSLPEERARAGGHGAEILCFEQVASWLQERVGKVVMPSTGKALAYDDVMLVVQRNRIADTAAGVLRRRGIPVAAAGKVQPQAVEDVVALLRVVFNPADNLALAQVLKGLRGWSDGQIMVVGMRAQGGAWRELVEGADAEWLAGYEALAWEAPLLLVQAIVSEMGFDGRVFEGLLGWAEAAETLRELVARMEVDDVPVVAGGHGVRILTVHGSKGLQAPLVILPDTMAGLGEVVRDTVLWGEDVVLFKQGKNLSALEDRLLEEEGRRKVADSLRGLYVAATRAMDWLVVCGFGSVKDSTDTWWTRVKAAMDEDVVGDTFEELDAQIVREAVPMVMPAWMQAVPEAKAVAVQSEAQGRGELLHGVLQGVATTADGVILKEVETVKAAFPWVFVTGGRWEVDVALEGGRVGRVDRVVERNGVWWVIDFKTGSVPEVMPEAYAAQVRGYVDALRATWPERTWQAAVLWTAAARLDEIPLG